MVPATGGKVRRKEERSVVLASNWYSEYQILPVITSGVPLYGDR